MQYLQGIYACRGTKTTEKNPEDHPSSLGALSLSQIKALEGNAVSDATPFKMTVGGRLGSFGVQPPGSGLALLVLGKLAFWAAVSSTVN